MLPALGVATCEPTEENAEVHAAAMAAVQAISSSAVQVQIRKRKADKLEWQKRWTESQKAAAARPSSGSSIAHIEQAQ